MSRRGPESGLPCPYFYGPDGFERNASDDGAMQCPGRTRVEYDKDFDERVNEKPRKLYCEKCGGTMISGEKIIGKIRAGSINRIKRTKHPVLPGMSDYLDDE